MSDLDTIRQADAPLARALEMARAVERFLDDLEQDDPGDDEEHFVPRHRAAQQFAAGLVLALKRLVRP